RDVDRLLDMAAQAGIYVIARPGPYINAETDDGGLPAWLSREPGSLRTNDPQYLAFALDWQRHIDAILARHQLTNRTGSVIHTPPAQATALNARAGPPGPAGRPPRPPPPNPHPPARARAQRPRPRRHLRLRQLPPGLHLPNPDAGDRPPQLPPGPQLRPQRAD